MRDGQHRWAIVLAAGEGTRLRALTTGADGVAIPKQFCSFDGGATLCEWALRRAERVVARERVAVVVASEHRHWVDRELHRHPAALAVVQPANRGTAAGILLPLTRVLACDPEATVLVLPSDHYIADEAVFADAAARALDGAERHKDALVLLATAPEDADPELGWIVPGRPTSGGLQHVDTFVEKPEPAVADDLLRQGGLVNTFVFAARASTLLALCEHTVADVVNGLRAADRDDVDLPTVYARLPVTDFSRCVLQKTAGALRLLRVPACGWSDLGTPARVAACVRRARAAQRPGGSAGARPVQGGSLSARALAAEARRRQDLAF